MYIDSPQNTLAIIKDAKSVTEAVTLHSLKMRREAARFLMNKRHQMPTYEQYLAAAQYMTELTGLDIPASMAEEILALYPHARIKLAIYGCVANEDVRSGLKFATAHIFLECAWPGEEDAVDLSRFLRLLQAQGIKMGFHRVGAYSGSSTTGSSARRRRPAGESRSGR